MARYRYGLTGRTAAYWAHAGVAKGPCFQWHRHRHPAVTATKRRYLSRWWARVVVRSHAYFAGEETGGVR